MNDASQAVDYQEALSIRVGRWLLERGYNLASIFGIPENSLGKSEVLGILWKDPSIKPRLQIFGLVVLKPKRRFFATIFLSSSARGANKQHWAIEMYGRKHIELVKQLTDEMASAFNVKISLRLVEEDDAFERSYSEIGY